MALRSDVAGEERRVGQGHPFHRAVRDVPFVPERDILEAGAEVAPQQAGQAAQPLRENRVALVRHGRTSLLAGAEGFFGLPELAAGQMADLGAHQLDGGADRGAGPEILGVTVTGDHLRRRHRLQAERGADVGFDGGIDVRVRPDGTRELADGDRIPGPTHALPVPIGLERPQGELGPERSRLGVHAVGAAGHRDVHELQGPGAQGVDERVEVGQQEIGGAGEGGAQRGVHHVRRGQPVVDVGAGRRADAVLDDVDERRHVVVGHPLPFEHVRHEDVVDGRRLGPAGRRVLGRHHADGGLRLGRQQLDLEPQPEAGGVGEQRRHVGRRIAGNHRTSSSRSSFDSSAARAAMSLRTSMPSQWIGSSAA